ncbi:ComEA family DNA-binding protein [Bacillota bacterium LX-D]|nr:ComEA family DNA-binding protein [Bacillota bacterium LX-D]
MWQQLPKQIKSLIVVLAAALVFGTGLLAAQFFHRDSNGEKEFVIDEANKTAESSTAQGNSDEQAVSQEIKIHVTGAVQKPGVYQLLAGARVQDAVNLAEPLPNANLDALNLAAPLNDGQKVTVPKKGEKVDESLISAGVTGGEVPEGSSTDGKVNLNTATLADLDGLPGVGPATAQRIIDYRTAHGGFKKVEELDEVSGIGPKKLVQLKDLVTVY